MELDELASRVDRLGTAVSRAGAELGRVDPGAAAFAGDGPGALFDLGRALHADWTAALSAREREAAAHGARLSDLAIRLRWAAEGYRDAEAGAHQRHRAQADTGAARFDQTRADQTRADQTRAG
jgi:hypothetical protein